jgi:hypothetical protein
MRSTRSRRPASERRYARAISLLMNNYCR